MMPSAIRYINLDEHAERREKLERQLAAAGMAARAQRYSAIKPQTEQWGLTRGELGCLLSHRAVLESHQGAEPLVVIEDDVVLSSRFSRVDELLTGIPANLEWDLLFLFSLPDFLDVRRLMRMLDVMRLFDNKPNDYAMFEAAEFYNWGTAAYVVNPNSRTRVVALIDAWLATGKAPAIDNMYRSLILQGHLKAQVLFPYLVGVDPGLPSTLSHLGRRVNLDEPHFAQIASLFLADADHLEGLTGHYGNFIRSTPHWREFAIAQALHQRLVADKLVDA